MSADASCPLPRSQVIDQYFMEHRAKLIDLAAFLDRVDRAEDDLGHADYRLVAMRRAIDLLSDDKGHRARRVLEVFSDPTDDPIPSAIDMKGAFGAWPGRADG